MVGRKKDEAVDVTLANASERCRDAESGTRLDERTELEEFDALINANARSSNGYWYWRDKPIAERGAARDILQEAGFDVANLVSRAEGEDPPDCEATLDGYFSGVEVTELVHQELLEVNIKATKERRAGQGEDDFLAALRVRSHHNWDRNAFLAKLRERIDAKDKPSKQKGGPYSGYVLVIHTDEDALDRETVGRFLQGSAFHTKYITDALLGLSYHPSMEPNGGCCPVFRLTLQNRAQFEILVDGAPRSYRDTKLTAMGAAHFLKMRAPDSEVVVKDLQTGELTVVAARD